MASTNNFFGIMKYKLDNGEYIVGYGLIISDKYYIQIPNDTKDGFSFAEVLPISCAKQIAMLPNNTLLFEYDVFETAQGELFYILFDYMRLAIVYFPVYEEMPISSNINIFECQCIGNLIFDDFYNYILYREVK